MPEIAVGSDLLVPDGVPILEHALAFSRTPFATLESWAEHGPVVSIEFPGQTGYLVTEPELVDEILHDTDRFTLGREQRERFEEIEEHAVQANTGERWRRLRTALQPAFDHGTLEQHVPTIVNETVDRVEQ